MTMASIRKNLRGKAQYGFGSRMAPNKGPVSAAGAQGYMRREMNKPKRPIQSPKGRDGQSDRRSGIAAQMIKQKQTQIKKFKNGGSKQTVTEQNFSPMKNAAQVLQEKRAAAQAAAQPPALKVNNAGLLELPYNQSFAEGQYDAVNEANDQLLGLKADADQQALEYGQTKRQLGMQYDQTKAQTLNKNAAGGTAFSSMYGTAVANNANQYANQMGDLEARNTSYQQNLAAQRAAIQNNLNSSLGRATQIYGDALGNEAGTLGYDNTRATPVAPMGTPKKAPLWHQKPKPKPKPKKKPKPKPKGKKPILPPGKKPKKPTTKWANAAKKSLASKKGKKR